MHNACMISSKLLSSYLVEQV